MINQQNFKKINEEFSCENCGKKVPLSEKTCRNHCPYCLYSKHVDKLPGDRANPCRGLLKPIGYHFHSKKGLMIDFKCQRCGEKTRNIALLEDGIQGDDYDQILALTPRK
ncbi:RNHCP domain-containing protein [Pseudobacteriovorax antillogorgiicola]|uniref:RNHCP domain-containing protein n=1 Tax=Pseudobacteriovorax antillogorgiicola TaxID=1513793 RepID=A0A1Y6BUQ7_9BACT|nr:RNHCP domain-containing protein [Pseudobacteriovorax antillogorgiicola]TCS52357.1 RNHCP domain-containing protein [Pseudobacteriovorax antillogorgiicola]SMF29491.1 RNHCP domain-containing protein [Pseudobacteriovorax antillogorgiicola]